MGHAPTSIHRFEDKSALHQLAHSDRRVRRALSLPKLFLTSQSEVKYPGLAVSGGGGWWVEMITSP